jgi:hypothetical protein
MSSYFFRSNKKNKDSNFQSFSAFCTTQGDCFHRRWWRRPGGRIDIVTTGKESFAFKLSPMFAHRLSLSRRRVIPLSTNSSVNVVGVEAPVLDKSSSSENKKEVTQSKAGSDFSNQSTGVENFSNQNITDSTFQAFETALTVIEDSDYHASDYTKARDKCFFFLYAMTNKRLNALNRITVKELNNMIVESGVESNKLKFTDLDGREITVVLSKHNLREDLKMIMKGKKENDFVFSEYKKEEQPLHRITISKRLHKILDRVSQRLAVPKEELEFP